MDPLQTLARALAETGGCIHQTYAHMEAAAAAGRVEPDAPPMPVALFMLLMDVLPHRLAEFDAIDLETAARVLDIVGEAMEEEFFLIPIDGSPEMN